MAISHSKNQTHNIYTFPVHIFSYLDKYAKKWTNYFIYFKLAKIKL